MTNQINKPSQINGENFSDFYSGLSDSEKTQVKLRLGINDDQLERFKEGLFFVLGEYRIDHIFQVMKSYGYTS